MRNFCNEVKVILKDSNYTKRYIKMSVALALIAVVYNLFICSISLVAGGSGGIGVLFNHLFGIDTSVVLFLFSFLVFILAFLFLDAEQVVSSLFVAIVYPLLVKVTSGLADIIFIDTSHVFIIVLFGAILTGFGQGMIFKLGLNIGGVSVIAKIVYKYTKLSVTLVNAVINALIVLAGGVFLGVSMILYAILFLVVMRMVSEKVILGISNNKTFKVISKEHEKIKGFIFELGHDVTVYDTYGAYGNSGFKLLMTVIPTSEFTVFKDYIKSIDKDAFIFVADTYEVCGQDLTVSKEMC